MIPPLTVLIGPQWTSNKVNDEATHNKLPVEIKVILAEEKEPSYSPIIVLKMYPFQCLPNCLVDNKTRTPLFLRKITPLPKWVFLLHVLNARNTGQEREGQGEGNTTSPRMPVSTAYNVLICKMWLIIEQCILLQQVFVVIHKLIGHWQIRE